MPPSLGGGGVSVFNAQVHLTANFTRDQQYQLRQEIREMKESDGEDSPKQYRIRNMRSQSNALGDWEFLPVNMPVRQKTSTMKLRKSLYNT